MSRCFPYPPPGYAKNGIRDQALIESIKLQREGEKAKKERKKDKRREKKEEEKARGNEKVDTKRHGDKKRHRGEKSQKDKKREDYQKSREPEIDHLEKSTLTEEHGQPVGSESSYDSTVNSNKRQKLCAVPDARHNTGSVIRFRLPLQRHKDLEMIPSKEQSCCPVRNNVAPVERLGVPLPIIGGEQHDPPCTASGNQELSIKISDEKPCLFVGASEHSKLSNEKPDLSIGASKDLSNQTKLAVPSNLSGSRSHPLALKYRDLVENWVPQQFQIEYDDMGDQAWLFETKQKSNDKQNAGSENCDAGTVGTSYGNLNIWPQSCYLPGADIHALPFTVPF